MILRSKAALVGSVLATLSLAAIALPVVVPAARAAGTTVQKFLTRGYSHIAGLGYDYVPGTAGPPFGSVEVSQTAPAGGKPGSAGPGLFAFAGVVAFPDADSAVEVFGFGEAAGTVTPPDRGFNTPGSVDVTLPATAISYTYDPVSGFYAATDFRTGTARVQSTLQDPAEVANARERSTFTTRVGLASFRTSSNFHGRFGYNPTGTVAVSFESDDGSVTLDVVPAGTPVDPEFSRFGNIQVGSITASK